MGRSGVRIRKRDEDAVLVALKAEEGAGDEEPLAAGKSQRKRSPLQPLTP